MRFEIEEDDGEKKENNGPQKIYLILAGILIFVAIIFIIVYIAIKSSKPTTPVEVPPITTPTPSPTEVKKLTVYDEDSNERPIAFMIDNAIGDAKHAGLLDSYLNYEIIVEGGITRIMAIYKDKEPSLIGPIRSSRHYFLDYALESDAIYVHYGWSPYAEDDTTKLNVDNINGLTDPAPFRRDTNSIAPHNVFTRMSYIRSYLETSSYDTESSSWQLFNYSAEEVDLSETNFTPNLANKISIPYSREEVRTYTYNEANQYYLRSSNGKSQYDRKSGEQLHYKNIIIEKVPNKSIDEEDRQELETTGKGTGYFITDGYVLPITWSKPTREAKTTYAFEDGTEITLNDGNTFVHIVPVDCEVTIE